MKAKMVVAIAVAFLISASCRHQSHQSQPVPDTEEADTLTTDSLLTDADTLLLDIETIDTPLPASMDELFDEFIFSFEGSNRLQRSRIRYPLPVTEADGQTRFVERRDWQHHYLFLHQDFCTTLWNSPEQMSLTEDVGVSRARVEQVYLHSRQITSFLFERDSLSHQWQLTQERIIPFEASKLGAFYDFFRQFATDSIFQRHHIADPLRFSITDEENEYERINGIINADQWFEFQPDIPRDVLINIHYGQTFHHPNRMLLQMRGIHNGLENLFTFRRENGQWRLVAFES